MRAWSNTAAVAGCLGALLTGNAVNAAEITVIASTAMREVLAELVPMFERSSGHKIAVGFLSGAVLPVKVKEGAQADLVVTTPDTIGDLVKAGKLVAGSRLDFVHSSAGVAVRAGAPKPDIATPEAFKAALVAAKTVGYSQGPSGQHFQTVMQKLGVTDAVKGKSVVVNGRPVGAAIASGEAEIGVQQVAELRPVAGVDVIGEMPAELQKQIPYSAGIVAKGKDAATAQAMVSFLRSPAALDVLKRKGMDLP
jgi:molybdate transport system substrate-binding protein